MPRVERAQTQTESRSDPDWGAHRPWDDFHTARIELYKAWVALIWPGGDCTEPGQWQGESRGTPHAWATENPRVGG